MQSLTSLSLVIALPLGAHFTNQQISRRVTIGAVTMVIGIALFLSLGTPQDGTSTPSEATWWEAITTSLVVGGILAGLGRRRSGAARALLFGSAAGVAFGLQSAVTKVFMTQIGHGISALLSSWTIYAMIVSALAGFVLQQSAFKTGVLAPAMASSNAVTLFATVVLGVTVFGETISNGNARLAPAIIGLGVAVVGIVLLAGAAAPPVDLEPGTTRPPLRGQEHAP